MVDDGTVSTVECGTGRIAEGIDSRGWSMATAFVTREPEREVVSTDDFDCRLSFRGNRVARLGLSCRRDLVHEPTPTQIGEHIQEVWTLRKRHTGKTPLDPIPAERFARSHQDSEHCSFELVHGSTPGS